MASSVLALFWRRKILTHQVPLHHTDDWPNWKLAKETAFIIAPVLNGNSQVRNYSAAVENSAEMGVVNNKLAAAAAVARQFSQCYVQQKDNVVDALGN